MHSPFGPGWIFLGSAALLAVALFLACSSESGSEKSSRPAVKANFIGRSQCAACHPTEAQAWTDSHHDLAMQEATEATVLGDFDDATLTHFGLTSTFYRDGERFMVRTDGPDGELQEYPIAYVFGVQPLQQYLVEFPGGRYQTLELCWDSRPEAEGGQRWFHLYPDEAIPAGDMLHWTGPNLNWNFMCAECHSTDLRKNYSVAEDRYATTWAELDVSCEACHGPGSHHAELARKRELDPAAGKSGFANPLRKQPGGWIIDFDTGLAQREPERASSAELETCARCHARRAPIASEFVHGRPLADTHRLSLLDENLYYADGQIQDEVYVYGSFIQSRMHAKGVSCSDCHDPHSGGLVAEGNSLCTQCHASRVFNTPEHHHHAPGSPGAQCVECHMPARNYMVVDPRRDHSFRIPRPDLSLKLDVPNACNQCHEDRSLQWAQQSYETWWGPERFARPHFGEALHAARHRLPNAQQALLDLLARTDEPAIARATALSLLETLATPQAFQSLQQGLQDTDPLVRAAAVRATELLEPQLRLRLLENLLDDPIRLVRIEVARILAAVSPRLMSEGTLASWKRRLAEYEDSLDSLADRAESHFNRGLLRQQRTQVSEAEQAYRQALKLDPHFTPAYLNLADLFRSQGNDEQAEPLLREAIRKGHEPAEAHHALGLLLVRKGEVGAAMLELERAMLLEPEDARFAYVYGIALNSNERSAEAVQVLEAAHRRHPTNTELLYALATILRDRGERGEAMRFVAKLLELNPADPAARGLQAELEGR